jgi:hypothetical protein
MTQFKEITLDELHKQIQDTRARQELADQHIKEMGENAQKVGLSITGATLEINTLMKQLFLCAQHDLTEYKILYDNLMQHMSNIALIANTRFGKIKAPNAPEPRETH